MCTTFSSVPMFMRAVKALPMPGSYIRVFRTPLFDIYAQAMTLTNTYLLDFVCELKEKLNKLTLY